MTATKAKPLLSADEQALLRRSKCGALTDDQFAEFLHSVDRHRLDPFANQIYAVTRGGRMTVQTGIDGYRLIADRTGAYAGNDDPVFDNEQKPTRATVSVYKVVGGIRCPFTASARWDQYYPGPKQGHMWGKMPHLMLGKCAEALALRKAFPAELSGLYITEEMAQADRDDAPSHEPATKPAPQSAPKPAAPKPPVKTEDATRVFVEGCQKIVYDAIGWNPTEVQCADIYRQATSLGKAKKTSDVLAWLRTSASFHPEQDNSGAVTAISVRLAVAA